MTLRCLGIPEIWLQPEILTLWHEQGSCYPAGSGSVGLGEGPKNLHF